MSWYTVRPTSRHEFHHRYMYDVQHSPGSGRRSIGENRNSPRRPLLGKRARSDYSTILQNDDNSDHNIPVRSGDRLSFFESIHSKRRDLGTSPRTRERAGELTIQFLTEGSGSTTACDSSATPTTPKAFANAGDMEQGEPTPRAFSRNSERHDGIISENDYGDDEGESEESEFESGLSSRNSYDGGRSRGYSDTQTPLLSSSLPYDPEQDHPHHEHLLHRQPSISTLLGDHAAIAAAGISSSAASLVQQDEESDELVEVHEDDDDAGAEPMAVGPSPSRRGSIYPSFPSYSSSYIPTHFPAPIHPSSPSASESTLHIRHHNVRRKVYGLSVDRLPVYLAVMWRAAAALRHIGHALWFAWAPALVFQGKFQWWCFLVLAVLAVRKGWNTVEWFGGSASRFVTPFPQVNCSD
jgi:hypothetical protein